MAHEYKRFVVIKILSQRNYDLEQYVCIPRTWIKVKDCDNDDVVFGYPSEHRDNIARLINQSLDKRWPILFGEVVHDTDSQADAFQVLKNKNSGDEHKTEDQSEKSKPENKKTKTTSEKEKSSSKKIKRKLTDSGDKMQNKQAKAKRSKDETDEIELQISKLMEIERESSSEESETEESEAEESESICNDTEIEDNDTPTTSRRSARAQSSKPDGYYRHIDDSSDSDYVPGYDINSKNKSTVKKGRSKRKVSESNRSNRSNQSEPSDNNENDDVDISDTNLCQINDEVHNQYRNFCTEFNESYKKTISIFDNAVNYLRQVINENEKISKVSRKKSKDDKERFKNTSESQPPFDASRYSIGDTKWTILYPEPCPGLVELIPHTGVYVSKEGLIKCQNTNQDATKLARALLEEIFKMEALFVCSFTGSVPKRGSKNNLEARPGLDVNARDTLVRYAEEYGYEMKMGYLDVVSIINSIKNQLQKYHSLSPKEKNDLLKKQATLKVKFMK
nr:dentin sialophosphoprotein [Helicoverpa armigera]